MRRLFLLLFAAACASAPAPEVVVEDKPTKTVREQVCIVNAKLADHDALKTVLIVEGEVAGIYEGEIACTKRIDAEGQLVEDPVAFANDSATLAR